MRKLMKSERAWNFNGSTANESTLKPLCQEVEKHVHLPSRRLCRYFATFEDSGLCDEIGKHYRGFYCPRSQTEGLPQYLMECFFRTDDEITGVNFGDLIAFDDLIYIRSTTCSDLTGCVLTYAHELQ